jgi:hypothetical protein
MSTFKTVEQMQAEIASQAAEIERLRAGLRILQEDANTYWEYWSGSSVRSEDAVRFSRRVSVVMYDALQSIEFIRAALQAKEEK